MSPRGRHRLAGALAVAGLLGAGWPLLRGASPAARAGAPGAPCDLAADRAAAVAPPDADGQRVVSITTTVAATCAPETRPLHLVVLVDASPDMAGETLRALQRVLEQSLRELALDARTDLEVGIVSFAADARVEGPLGHATDRLVAAVRDIRTRDGECLACGLSEAVRMLRAARGTRDPSALRDVVVIASSGIAASCAAVRQTASEARAYGVLVVTTCQGRACLDGCVADAAAQSRYAFQFADWDALRGRIAELVESRGAFHPIEEVTLVDMLARSFAYLDGGDPSGGIGNRLTWAFAPWDAPVVTRTYRARALACGAAPLAVDGEARAMARFSPAFPGAAPVVAAVPNLVVDVPCDPPTPPAVTPSAPSPTTVTPRPSPTPAATRTAPAPSATTPPADGRTHRAWLPLALTYGCARFEPPRDLVLVLDVSYSMALTEVPGLGDAWSTSRALALRILDGLRPGLDRIGIVAFGDGAPPDGLAEWALAPCCAPALRAAVATFWRLDGSRADVALTRAAALLDGADGADRAAGVVLVTDGELNQTPLGELGGAMAGVRARRASLDVVLFGAAPDPRLVEAVAAAGARVAWARRAPPEALVQRLAGGALCR